MAALQGIVKFQKSIGVRSSVIYTFSNCLSKGVSFLLLLYFANALTINDFGILSLFNTSVLFLLPLVSMNLPQSVNTAFFKKDKATFQQFFSTVLIMPMMATFFIMALLFSVNGQLQNHYTFPLVIIAMMPLLAFFRFLNEQLLQMVRNSNNPIKYLSVNIARALAEITLVVFFTGAMEWGWVGCVAGIFIAYLMVAFCAFFYFKEQGFVVNQFNKKYISLGLSDSTPAVMMQLGMFCMGASVIYFIEFFTQDLAQVGEFSMATVLSSAIMVLCVVMVQYIWPKIHSQFNRKNINYTAIRKHILFYAWVMLMCTGFVIIAIPLVYAILIKEQYQTGLTYYFFICLGCFFCSINILLYAILRIRKEKNNLLLLSILSIFTSVVSHILFTAQWGAYGAALSVCIVHFVAMCVTIIFMKKHLTQILSTKPVKTA